MEKFNPEDEQYKEVADLPPEKQREFRDMYGGGFVSRGVVNKEDAEKMAYRDEKLREILEKVRQGNAQENAMYLTPERQEFVKREMVTRLYGGDIDEILKIKEKLSLSEEFVQEVAKEVMVDKLTSGGYQEYNGGYVGIDIDGTLEIKEKLSLPDEFVQQVVKEAIAKRLEKVGNRFAGSSEESNKINNIFKIKEKFSIPDEVLQSPEIQQAAKEAMERCLDNSAVAHKIKEKFKL